MTHTFPTRYLYLLPLLPLLRDLLEAKTQGFPFHLSESLLFNALWWLFLPGIYLAYRWKHYPRPRLLLLLVALHLSAYLLLTGLLSYLFFDYRYDLLKFTSYAAYRDFFLLLSVYTALALFLPSAPPTFLGLKDGRESLRIPFSSIRYIQACSPYVSLHLPTKKHLHTSSLKKLEAELPQGLFLRIHRNTLVNVEHISSLTSRLNGDYDLHLKDGETLKLSRTYAAACKKLFHSDQILLHSAH